MAERVGARSPGGWLQPWIRYLGVTGAGIAAFLALPRASAGQVLILLGLCAAEVCLLGIATARAPAADRPAWAMLTGGQVLYFAAYVVWFAYPVLLEGNLPFPSIADALFIGSYLADAVGAVLLIRARGGGFESWIDSAMIGVSLAVPSWLFIISPSLRQSDLPLLGRLVSVSYPLLDLVIVALAVRLAFLTRARPGLRYLLVLWMLSQLVSDTIYALELQGNTFRLGGSDMVGWLASFGFLGAAALLAAEGRAPSAEPPRPALSPRLLIGIIAVAVTLPPLTQAGVELKSGDLTNAVVDGLAVGLFLLVLVRTLALMVDVDAYRRGEKKLIESRRRFVQVLDSLPVAVAVGDQTGYTFWNPAAGRMFGGAPSRDKARWADTEAPVGPDYAILPRTLGGESLRLSGIEVLGPDRPVPVEVLTEPVRDAAGQVVEALAVFSDVSERLLREAVSIESQREIQAKAAELERSNAELERSNAELEQFAYVASHDLQEPLRMVASYMQLLERRYKGRLDADADEFIEYAVDGARRMQVLITDLLAYARLGSRGKPFQVLESEPLVSRALQNLAEAIAASQAEIEVGSLPPIRADGGQVVQLFQNLIGNAIKFGRPGVPLRVEVRGAQEGDHIRFSVVDNGIGIGTEYADRIFVIFQRLHTRDEYGGTGIGLAICKKIAERHGGRIWVDSDPGYGSTFHFTVPSGGGPA